MRRIATSLPKKGPEFKSRPRRKFNFFLFADASIILNRKKELSKETIESLTKDYTQLFHSLQSKSSSSIYMPINNIDLETTLNQIIKTVNLA